MLRFFRRFNRFWCDPEFVGRRRQDGRIRYECVACGKPVRSDSEMAAVTSVTPAGDVPRIERQRLEALVRMDGSRRLV